MILTPIAQLDRYRGIARSLDTAIDFVEKNDLTRLETGRNEIDGDTVFALRQTYQSRKPSETPFESHERYIDLQIVTEGTESMYWAPVDTLPVTAEYDETKDAALYGDATSARIEMEAGWCCIFFPEDGHKPACMAGDQPEEVGKIVVKCRMSD